MGLGGDAPEGSTGDAAAASSGAAPVPAYIQAAKRRKRIPYWAMTALAALPLWGYVYVRTLEPAPTGETDPLALGAEQYSASCSSCHGGTGGGVSAPGFVDGAVIETFPDWRDQAAWVRLGTDNWPAPTYGANEKPVGGGGIMPPWATLTDQQIAQVVLHERSLSGDDVAEDGENAEAYADLYAVARGEMTLAEAELGPVAEAAGVTVEDLGG